MAESRASWTVNSAFQLTLFQFELENDELHFNFPSCYLCSQVWVLFVSKVLKIPSLGLSVCITGVHNK